MPVEGDRKVQELQRAAENAQNDLQLTQLERVRTDIGRILNRASLSQHDRAQLIASLFSQTIEVQRERMTVQKFLAQKDPGGLRALEQLLHRAKGVESIQLTKGEIDRLRTLLQKISTLPQESAAVARDSDRYVAARLDERKAYEKVEAGRKAERPSEQARSLPPPPPPRETSLQERPGIFQSLGEALKKIARNILTPPPRPPEPKATQKVLAAAPKGANDRREAARDLKPSAQTREPPKTTQLFATAVKEMEPGVREKFLEDCHEGCLRFGDFYRQCLSIPPQGSQAIPEGQFEVGRFLQKERDRSESGSQRTGSAGPTGLTREAATRTITERARGRA